MSPFLADFLLFSLIAYWTHAALAAWDRDREKSGGNSAGGST